MLTTILLTLILGITLGTLLLTLLLLYLTKIKCPNCKELKPLKEIILLNFKTQTITGQPCLKCQRPKPQLNL